jgi:hypothetical protein
MNEQQQKLSISLQLLSDDAIEEQKLFEDLAMVCFKHYKVEFVDISELDNETANIITKRYSGSVKDYFFDSANCMAYKNIIPKLIKLLTK